MELKKIKEINQKIYELDNKINRNSKMMFIASLIFCCLNKDFKNPSKTNEVVNIMGSLNPIDDLIKLAKSELKKIKLLEKTLSDVEYSLNIISGSNTKLADNRIELKNFINDFVCNVFPLLSNDENLFLETLYMEIDKKAKNSDKGITLTPAYAAQLMIDLADLDYKVDVVADLSSGTGLFSLLSYSKMLNDLNADKKNNKISEQEYSQYKLRLFNSIIANDNDEKMVTLCLANFIIKELNTGLIYSNDIFNLSKSDFYYYDSKDNKVNLKPTKAILNPPYEDEYKPMEIVLKNIELLKGNSDNGKVIAILPASKFGQNRATFYNILVNATLKNVIKMQSDLFSESGQSPSTCIFEFDLSKEHNKNDLIHYFDFTDSGYVYLKDSGMVDKNKTHKAKKAELLKLVKQAKSEIEPTFIRTWNNFYDVGGEKELIAKINPDEVKINKDIADISFENITIKKMLKEKNDLLNSVNGLYYDKDKSLEKYVVDILSEE